MIIELNLAWYAAGILFALFVKACFEIYYLIDENNLLKQQLETLKWSEKV